jgi:predicted Fe-S protein YdhL (DUF1289 family)
MFNPPSLLTLVARALCKACGRDPDATLNEVPEWVYRQVEAQAVLSAVREATEQIISAWAFANDIDGAARNDLFARLRGPLPPAPASQGDEND